MQTQRLQGFLLAVNIELTERKAIFRTSEQKVKTGSEELYLVSEHRFDILLRILAIITGAVSLILPLFVLLRLQPASKEQFERKSNYQMLTIFAFVLAFGASYSIFTKARIPEVFMATAAYSAVLIIFLGSVLHVLM